MSFREYSIIVFFYNGQPRKWEGIRNLGEFITSLEKDNPGWKYINIYDPRDKTFIKRLYKGNISVKDLSGVFKGA